MEIYGSAPEWVQHSKEWYIKAGFEVIVLKKTIPGHVLNSFMKVNFAHGNKLVRDGVCSPADVNTAMRHLGRDFYGRNMYIVGVSMIGGERGFEGGRELALEFGKMPHS